MEQGYSQTKQLVSSPQVAFSQKLNKTTSKFFSSDPRAGNTEV